ncbi:SpoIIE family protein phosphatase [Polystyrenella longa]|uniref:SpoIIE family protein phosphatase n=1 Tax=Polystyrenella longa TaxID=2528007 RepID=UPI0018D219E5|nr:SpoIIE family protein phosphatase [Polystyrenella longa]
MLLLFVAFMNNEPAELPKLISGAIIVLCFVPFLIIQWISATQPEPALVQATRGDLQATPWEVDQIEIRDLSDNTPVALLNTHIHEDNAHSVITSLLILPDKEFLICGKANGTIQVWNLDNEKLAVEINSIFHPIVSVAVHTETKTLLAVSNTGSVSAWNLEGGEPILLQQVKPDIPASIRFYHDIDFHMESVVRKQFWYTIIEWTAVCIALITGFLSIIHYYTVGDVSTPIVGTALFFSGLIDAFNLLSADHLINSVEDTVRFIPITWAISRTFNVSILILGTSLILLKRNKLKQSSHRSEIRFLAVVAFIFAMIAYAIVHICSVLPELPQAIYLDGRLAKRPWDILPLALLLLAGTVVFPRFYRKYPSLFSYGIFLSVVPHLATQIHAVFWSSQVFDPDFFAAHSLRLLAYLVPFIGLILDYNRVHEQEATYQETQQKLLIARSVQQNLLPQSAPKMKGIDLAGRSQSSDTVGGDYFDYLQLGKNRLGIVIGDVSGHDFGASLFMAQTRAYLRALSTIHDDLSDAMRELNEYLTNDSHTHRFVTMFLARFNLESQTLDYCAAGHQSLVLNSDKTTTIIGPTGPPLGVMEDGLECAVEQIPFKPGSILVELTDGILEVKNEEGVMFGNDHVFSILNEHQDKTSEELVELIISTALEYSDQPVPYDDMTVVVMKFQK